MPGIREGLPDVGEPLPAVVACNGAVEVDLQGRLAATQLPPPPKAPPRRESPGSPAP
jgi:hypothetical protein